MKRLTNKVLAVVLFVVAVSPLNAVGNNAGVPGVIKVRNNTKKADGLRRQVFSIARSVGILTKEKSESLAKRIYFTMKGFSNNSADFETSWAENFEILANGDAKAKFIGCFDALRGSGNNRVAAEYSVACAISMVASYVTAQRYCKIHENLEFFVSRELARMAKTVVVVKPVVKTAPVAAPVVRSKRKSSPLLWGMLVPVLAGGAIAGGLYLANNYSKKKSSDDDSDSDDD